MKFDLVFEKLLSKHLVFEKTGKTIVIFPGGFHPFHIGHKSIFDNIQKTFPDAETYIAITGYTEERPFTAEEKKLIISSTGIDPNKVVEVKSPFRSEEILKNYNPKTDKVVFVASEKEKLDSAKKSLFTRVKKDGTPSYFQDYDPSNLQPFEKHGYIYLFPTLSFGKEIFGKDIKNASELRMLYSTLSDKQKMTLIKRLYVKNFDTIKKIFDKHLIDKEESDESPFLTKELIKDRDKEFNDVFLNPPYQVDNQLTVGRMKY